MTIDYDQIKQRLERPVMWPDSWWGNVRDIGSPVADRYVAASLGGSFVAGLPMPLRQLSQCHCCRTQQQIEKMYAIPIYDSTISVGPYYRVCDHNPNAADNERWGWLFADEDCDVCGGLGGGVRHLHDAPGALVPARHHTICPNCFDKTSWISSVNGKERCGHCGRLMPRDGSHGRGSYEDYDGGDVECASCRIKSGTPTLCHVCQDRQFAGSEWTDDVDREPEDYWFTATSMTYRELARRKNYVHNVIGAPDNPDAVLPTGRLRLKATLGASQRCIGFSSQDRQQARPNGELPRAYLLETEQ